MSHREKNLNNQFLKGKRHILEFPFLEFNGRLLKNSPIDRSNNHLSKTLGTRRYRKLLISFIGLIAIIYEFKRLSS